MPVADFNCGPCDSGMTLDVEEEHALWLFANRWAAAHVECGWIVNPNIEPEKLVLGPDDLPPPHEFEQSGSEGADTLEQ